MTGFPGNGTKIYAGCKITGAKTLILDEAVIGYEAPATVEDCQVGPEVHLNGGFFSRSVFLEKAGLGYGAHVRGGTILEEEASVAHTVGLKQSILFPFVTLGSLINFCDCFMAGGTSRKNHSEVGSSFIHFNYTPNQDKATPSMMGDVPLGVMLNQNPIFLGGQGGLVGPVRLAFGTITAAGTIYRKDELRNDRLLLTGYRKDINIPFTRGRVPNLKRILQNNLLYVANLIALKFWYANIRSEFISDLFPQALLEGLLDKVEMNIAERLKRIAGLISIAQQGGAEDARTVELAENWAAMAVIIENFNTGLDTHPAPSDFLDTIRKEISKTGPAYIRVIQQLDPESAVAGSKWLQQVIHRLLKEVFARVPSFGFALEGEETAG